MNLTEAKKAEVKGLNEFLSRYTFVKDENYDGINGWSFIVKTYIVNELPPVKNKDLLWETMVPDFVDLLLNEGYYFNSLFADDYLFDIKAGDKVYVRYEKQEAYTPNNEPDGPWNYAD